MVEVRRKVPRNYGSEISDNASVVIELRQPESYWQVIDPMAPFYALFILFIYFFLFAREGSSRWEGCL